MGMEEGGESVEGGEGTSRRYSFGSYQFCGVSAIVAGGEARTLTFGKPERELLLSAEDQSGLAAGWGAAAMPAGAPNIVL